MSLNHGRTLLAIPGPSVMPDRVLSAMHQPSPNIYAGPLVELTKTLFPDLKRVARTSGNVAIYIANGHGAWEAALRNTINPGERVLVLATGRFAALWGKMAETFGIEVEVLNFGMQGHADPAQLEQLLRDDKSGEIKAILTVQGDTASSVKNDIPALRQAIDAAGHSALFMVDCIASLGCDRFEMDEWGVDLVVAACQKGLMTPAGLAFIYFNEKAEIARKQANPSQYWDWNPRAYPDAFYQQFCGTAPTQHLFGLREALTMLVHEEGIENAWHRHETISSAVWAAVDAWATGGQIRHNIADRQYRTVAVTALHTAPGDGDRIREWCETQAGVTLGIGLGYEPDVADRHFRIGHMGHQNIHMVMGVLGAIESALVALEIPHGEGALSAAAKILAAH